MSYLDPILDSERKRRKRIEINNKIADIIDDHCCAAWKNCDHSIIGQEEGTVYGDKNKCLGCKFYEMYQRILEEIGEVI